MLLKATVISKEFLHLFSAVFFRRDYAGKTAAGGTVRFFVRQTTPGNKTDDMSYKASEDVALS